jgi:hypothetical protein
MAGLFAFWTKPYGLNKKTAAPKKEPLKKYLKSIMPMERIGKV